MTKIKIVRPAFAPVALALALAACGGGVGGDSNNPGEPPTVITKQEDQFGVAFGAAFRAPLDSEPKAVNDGDIVPVSLTTEPINITG